MRHLTKISSLILLSGFLFFSACTESDMPGTTSPTATNLDELVVPSDFDWKTKKELEVNINIPYQGVITILSNDGSTIYAKGLSTDNVFTRSITLPAYENELLIEFGSQTNQLNIKDLDQVDHTFMQTKSAMVVANNLLTNNDLESSPYNYLFENNLQSNVSSSNLNNWILKSYQNNKPNAEIDDIGGSHNNVIKMTDNKSNKIAFAYYYVVADAGVEYTLEAEADLVDDENDLEAYLRLSFMGANGQEIEGYSTTITDQNTWANYSITETSPANTTYIKVICSTSNNGEGEVHFDNFFLSGASNDMDGDGVEDDNDDYPNDATKAFGTYYPATGAGVLAFEDTWPAKADYDFNDLVISYRFLLMSNAANQMVEMTASFEILNNGAGYKNGFGFELLGNNPSWYSSISGVLNNSFEAGQTNPVVILSEEILFNHEGNTFDLVFTFQANSASSSDINIANWNPFLIANGVRGQEIHLPYNPPTDLADASLFGTNHDDSDASVMNKSLATKTYLTENNLPWAIDVSDDFSWTVEKTPINQAYSHFISWANSSGSTYADWYLPAGASGSETGYRDDTKIE